MIIPIKTPTIKAIGDESYLESMYHPMYVKSKIEVIRPYDAEEADEDCFIVFCKYCKD
tara:strand:+ start:235 stop:408 length:174 start_codon:yes stop_codon:yes gene_type:complete